MRKITCLALLGAAACLASAPADAETVRGSMRCTVAGGIGLVVSAHAVNCVYYRPDGNVEFYIGSSNRIVDIGVSNPRRLAFTVVVKEPAPPAVLEGDYVGAGAGLTAGTGVAADALANARGAILIPAATYEMFTGFDVNAGVGSLRLRYAGAESKRVRERY